jgi:polysaccharide export outer membrane protein
MKLLNLQWQIGCAALAVGFWTVAGCAAQEPAPQATAATPPPAQAGSSTAVPAESPNPVLTVRDDKLLDSFQPPVDEEYTLGPGDDIALDFPTQPELDTKTTVGPDGIVSLKDAGPVHVAGLSRDGAGLAVQKALSQYYKNVSVTVSIDKYSSNSVRVTGYVQHPGSYTFEGTPTLLDAIGKAGMISPQVTANGVSTNIGPGIPETCTIYRGNNTAVQVELGKLLRSGSTLADMRLRRNDIVYVPQPKELFVSVMGQVARPGTVPLTPNSTLTSVLAQAGCCGDNAGFNPKIQIVQPSTGKNIVVNYKELLTVTGQTEYALHSGDVIFVQMNGLSKFGIIMTKIAPIGTMVSLAAIAGAG